MVDLIEKENIEIQEQSLNAWVEGMDYEKRQEVVELLFDIINSSGANSLNDFIYDFGRCSKGISKSLAAMDETDRSFILGLVKELAECINENVREYMSEHIVDEKEKYKKKAKEGAMTVNQYLEQMVKLIENMHS